MSITSSLAAEGTSPEVTVRLMKQARSQEETVTSTLLEGVKESGEAVQAQSRQAFSTGQKLDVVA